MADQTYTPRQVREACGVTQGALNMWHQRANLPDLNGAVTQRGKARQYSLADAAVIATVAELTANGVAVQRAGEIASTCRETLERLIRGEMRENVIVMVRRHGDGTVRADKLVGGEELLKFMVRYAKESATAPIGILINLGAVLHRLSVRLEIEEARDD